MSQKPVNPKAAAEKAVKDIRRVWAHLHDVLYCRTRELEGRDASPTAAIIDSQSVRTGAEAREKVGFDAGKRVKGRRCPGGSPASGTSESDS